MVALAQQNIAGTRGQVIRADHETWEAPIEVFDLVVSRLVFHYLAGLESVLTKAHQALVPGGRIVFSVEHPVITSCDRAWQGQGLRQDWIVDDRFSYEECGTCEKKARNQKIGLGWWRFRAGRAEESSVGIPASTRWQEYVTVAGLSRDLWIFKVKYDRFRPKRITKSVGDYLRFGMGAGKASSACKGGKDNHGVEELP